MVHRPRRTGWCTVERSGGVDERSPKHDSAVVVGEDEKEMLALF
jgi:hypothetical protein